MCDGSAAASITLRDAVQLISGCDTGNDAQDADVKIHRGKKNSCALALHVVSCGNVSRILKTASDRK